MLPDCIGKMTDLKTLWLERNRLTSTLPDGSNASIENALPDAANASIGGMTALEGLYLGGNNLTSTLPDGSNASIENAVPASIGSLTAGTATASRRSPTGSAG